MFCNMPGYPNCPSKAQSFPTYSDTIIVHIISVREFNTTQVCSNCRESVKLCGIGTRRDPFRDYNEDSTAVINRHFVGRCSNQTCGTICHRDVNAARNIALLAYTLYTRWNDWMNILTNCHKARIFHQARDHEDEN
jgi:hypothetical protein